MAGPDPFLAAQLSALPPGRMLAVRQVEAALREGRTYAEAARRAKVSEVTAKRWAAAFAIRKSDLEAERAEARLARHTGWAVALAGLGRYEEAGAYEADARKLERLLAQIARRAEAAGDGGDAVYDPARALLGRISADMWTAHETLAAYYDTLRALGADCRADGRVRWPGGVPRDVPETPDWLPCVPWAVEDEAAWEAGAGAGIRLL